MSKQTIDWRTTSGLPGEAGGLGQIGEKQNTNVTKREGWGQCLERQIKEHPRIAVGIGLMAGLAIGWWVKR